MADTTSVTVKLTAPQFRLLEETFDTALASLTVRSGSSAVDAGERRKALTKVAETRTLREAVFGSVK